jgi:hypothetical protein
MQDMSISSAQLAPLQALSTLQTLLVTFECGAGREGLKLVGQMTGLRSLSLSDPVAHNGGLLQLLHLQQLTKLYYSYSDYYSPHSYTVVDLNCKVSRQ